MKIAVTAANGQLGSSIIAELKKEIEASQIVGIVRTPEKSKHHGIEIRKGDYNDSSQFNLALKDIDKVLLISGIDDPAKRVLQHRNVIEAAKLNGVQKIIYTSIIGSEKETAFSSVVQSNRQTEKDVMNSGMDWVVGRNGIYIEPDLDYIDTYKEKGEISNCAADGKCGYTSRSELGYAYTQMLLKEEHLGKTYNLSGVPISQSELADYMNQIFGTNLSFRSMSVEAYEQERKAELGDFIGSVIAGIYDGIKKGVNQVPSNYKEAAGRSHLSPLEMMKVFEKELSTN